jgi:hypothetical protein
MMEIAKLDGESPCEQVSRHLLNSTIFLTLTLNAGLRDTNGAVVVVLGVHDVQSSRSDSLETNRFQNTALYARELIQLMADPSVMMMPSLNGTERVIPARMAPQLPPFPACRFPTHGNTVLLVIPTENKNKISIFKECVAGRTPPGVRVHTALLPVESNVGEQPYNEAGATGAYNRICNALERLHSPEFADVFAKNAVGTVMVASIESYIQTENIDRPADFGIAVVHNATTNQTCLCSSRGVTAPPEYIHRARRFGTDGDANHGNVTVGRVLAARVPELDKADWHAVLAGCSRYELLREAVRELPIPW